MQTRTIDLLAEIEDACPERLVSSLIRIPSVNPKDIDDCRRFGITAGEGMLAQMIYERLTTAGLEARLEEIVPGRPNLIACYDTGEPGPTLVFNAHTDTIGAYDMGERAFQPEIRDGRLYGRGAADMKGALGCFVVALESLAKLRIPLHGKVVLTAVIGEEGPPSGTEYLVQHGFQADGAIVGEASNCRLFFGQRGGQFVLLRTHGKTAHGSMPEAGINAIEDMVRLLASLSTMDLFQELDPRFGPPTCTIGTIRGGVRTNVVADLCEATLDVRLPPGILPQDVLIAFQERIAVLGIRGEAEAEEPGFPAFLTSPDMPVVQAATSALQELGMQAEMALAPYWSDLAYLKEANISSIVLGPGSILQAHSGDEFVEVEQLVQAAKIYALAAVAFCGGKL